MRWFSWLWPHPVLRSPRKRASRRMAAAARLLQPRRLEQFAAVGRDHCDLDALAVAIDRQRHRDARLAGRQDAAEELGGLAHRCAIDCGDDAAGPQTRLLCGSVRGEAGHDDLVIDLGGVEAEPGARLSAGAA